MIFRELWNKIKLFILNLFHINRFNISERSQVATNAGYILNLSMDSPTHGYYFGLYEIGEFSLINKRKLIIDHSFRVKNCYAGCVAPNNHMIEDLYCE